MGGGWRPSPGGLVVPGRALVSSEGGASSTGALRPAFPFHSIPWFLCGKGRGSLFIWEGTAAVWPRGAGEAWRVGKTWVHLEGRVGRGADGLDGCVRVAQAGFRS